MSRAVAGRGQGVPAAPPRQEDDPGPCRGADRAAPGAGLCREHGRERHPDRCSWTRIAAPPAAHSSSASSGSGYFDIVGGEDTADRVEPWLVTGRAQLALVIAAGYGDEAAAGRTPRVQVIADGSDSNSAVVGLGYASRIVRQAERARSAARPRPGRCSPRAGRRIELVPRVWYNPDLKSRWFYVPAVLAMVLLLVTMILPSMAVVREKEIGTLEQIIVTPLQPWQLHHRQADPLRGDRPARHAADRRPGAPRLRRAAARLAAAADVPDRCSTCSTRSASACWSRPW